MGIIDQGLQRIDLKDLSLSDVGSRPAPEDYIERLAFDTRSNTLYGLDHVTQSLVRIDPTTGQRYVVGALNAVFNPYHQHYGMAYDPVYDRLLATDGGSLVQIDSKTGLETSLSSDINRDDLAIDADAKLLYRVGGSGELQSTTLDTFTTTTIGPLADTVGTYLITGLAYDPQAQHLYGVDANSHQLLLIDRATGAAQPVSLVGYKQLHGLAWDPRCHCLYSFADETHQLVRIDVNEGTQTAVGGMILRQIDGLALDAESGKLYGVENSNTRLLRIDPASGDTTVIGPFNPPLNSDQRLHIAYDSDTKRFYVINYDLRTDSNTLLIIETNAGSSGGMFATRKTFDLGAKAIADITLDVDAGVLYGIDAGRNALITIDTATGEISSRGNFAAEHVVQTLTYNSNDKTLFGFTQAGQLVSIDPASAGLTPLGFIPVTGPVKLNFAAFTGILYAYLIDTKSLAVVDTATPGLTQTVTLPAQFPGNMAYDGPLAMVGLNPATGNLLHYNIDKGTYFTSSGSYGFRSINNLGYDTATHTLYAVDYLTDTLVTLDRQRGTAVGRGRFSANSLVGGMAFDANHGRMYFVDMLTSYLHYFDAATLRSVPIGATGFNYLRGLAYVAATDTLYGIRGDYTSVTSTLVRIDTVTGRAAELKKFSGIATSLQAIP